MKYELSDLSSEDDYRQLYLKIYCRQEAPIFTFDGIRVKFFPERFDHAFFESKDWEKADKSIFSRERAERILWIKDTLEDPSARLICGWDKNAKQHRKENRVAVVKDNYVVVIWIQNKTTAKFLTAYVADNSIGLILAGPPWTP